ncbi:MAG: ferrous iron transport protein A [Armatimonadetes bacterium]|nr:ferrous iron transport protein A [Armatimonadota bacterium]
MADTLTFDNLKKGMRVRIAGVSEEAPFCGRLMELGLTPDAEFTVIKVAPLGDPVEIDLRGYKLCLRRSECSCLKVALVD